MLVNCPITPFELSSNVNPMHTWVIYFHDVEGLTIYIGMCKLIDLYTCPDVRSNAEWYKLTDGKTVTVKPICQTDNYAECKIEWTRLVGMFRPRANLYSRVKRIRARVRCIDTGVEYDNASDAALRNGVSQSALSNHLNGRVGYDTVHGLRFERIK